MTTTIRDQSHFDGNTTVAGYGGTTHKITEGTGFIDPAYVGRMAGWRTSAAGLMLGSYHVLHTGNLSSQLDFWISQQDKLTPWWRDWPHWIMQIDAEKWPNDPVTLADGSIYRGPLHLHAETPRAVIDPARYADHLQARISTTVAFAGMLTAERLPCLPITYASRGQYGNSLTGISTDLWNAAYHGTTYPGDSAADWAPYSGRTPVLWQFTSTPYDKSAFRGSLADLLAYIEGGGVAEALDLNEQRSLGDIESLVVGLFLGRDAKYTTSVGATPITLVNALQAKLNALAPAPAPTQEQVTAAVTQVMNDPAWLAKVAAAFASHIKVS